MTKAPSNALEGIQTVARQLESDKQRPTGEGPKRHTACSPSSFILTISYSPPSGIFRPRPRPLDMKKLFSVLPTSPLPASEGGCEVESDCCCWDAPTPIEMGLSSRHRQAQIPRTVMSVALASWRPHQSKLAGREWVYSVVATRWRK